MKLAVSGLTDVEATEGLPHLLDEFQQRPWLLKVGASWNSDGGNLMVQVQVEGANRENQEGISGFIRDEVWDCIIACFRFTSTLHFDVREQVLVPAKEV
jgi:hypothetical protein